METGSVAFVIGTGRLELGSEVGPCVAELVILGMVVGPSGRDVGILTLSVGLVTGGVEAEAEVTPVFGPERVGMGALDALPVGVGTLELAVITVGRRVRPPEADVGSVLLAIAELVGRMALVISEIIPPRPPVEEAVGAADVTSVALAVGTAEVASVALAVGTGIMAELVGGRTALVISEIMPPKPAVVEAEEAAEGATEVGTAEDAAELVSVALAVGAGRIALVISEMIPPKPPEAEVVGTTDDAAEVTPVGTTDDAAELASVALAVGAGRIALVRSEMIPPRPPEAEVVGAAVVTAEDAAEVTSVATDDAAEVN